MPTTFVIHVALQYRLSAAKMNISSYEAEMRFLDLVIYQGGASETPLNRL